MIRPEYTVFDLSVSWSCVCKGWLEIAFLYVFRADGVLGAAIAGAGMVVVGGTVLALAGAAALVGIFVKKKWGDATQDISQKTFHPLNIII